jgi:hypothetical protein
LGTPGTLEKKRKRMNMLLRTLWFLLAAPMLSVAVFIIDNGSPVEEWWLPVEAIPQKMKSDGDQGAPVISIFATGRKKASWSQVTKVIGAGA